MKTKIGFQNFILILAIAMSTAARFSAVAALSSAIMLFSQASLAASNSGFVYSGRILKPDNTPINAGSLTITVSVYSPLPNKCLLYQERFTGIDMTNKMGTFSVSMGQPTPVGTRLDSTGYTFKQLISNAGTTFTGLSCAVGNSYSPSASDERIMEASFYDGITTSTVSDLSIKSVPYAMETAEIGGYGIMNLAKISGAGSATALTPLEYEFLKNLAIPASLSAVPCAANQILRMNAGGTAWECANSGGGESTTVTNLGAVGAAIGNLNGTAVELKKLIGTTNQITTTQNANDITFSLPTNIAGSTLGAAPGVGQNGQTLRWNNGLPGWEWFTPGTGTVTSLGFATNSDLVLSNTGTASAPVISIASGTVTGQTLYWDNAATDWKVGSVTYPMAAGSLPADSLLVGHSTINDQAIALAAPATPSVLITAAVTNDPTWSTGANNQFLKGGAAGVSWGAVDISTADVTGTLPVNKGGTGQSSFVTGEILVGNTTGNTLSKVTMGGDATINATGVVNVQGLQGKAIDNAVLPTVTGQIYKWNNVTQEWEIGTDNVGLTSPMTTLGDIIYGGAAGAGTRLAGNTTATKQFLTQTGDGTNSAAPAWGTLAAGDIPDISATYWKLGGNAPASSGVFGTTTNQDLSIITNNTAKMTILKTGEVGIGTATPALSLDVSGSLRSSGAAGSFLVNQGNTPAAGMILLGEFAGAGGNGAQLRFTGATGFVDIGQNASGDFVVEGSDVPRFVVQRTGGAVFSPAADSIAINSTGYSLTGANAQSLVDLSGTWNTTGTPTLIKANVTDTASNAASNLMDLQVGGVSKFRVDKTGKVYGDGSGLTGVSASGAKLSGLTAADATNSIDSLNFAQTWNWSTASTQNPLTVNANALTTGSILTLATSNATVNSTSGLLNVANTGASTSGVLARFQSNSTAGSGMTILADGKVGIGTTSPPVGSALQVVGGDVVLGTTGSPSSLVVSSSVNSNTRARIDTTSDHGYFRLFDSTNAQNVAIHSSGDSYFMGGNVGIGDNTPTYKLDVSGVNNVLRVEHTNTAGGTALSVVSTDTDAGSMTLGYNSTGSPELSLNSTGLIAYQTFLQNSVKQIQLGHSFGNGQNLTSSSSFQIGIDAASTGTGVFEVAKGNSWNGRAGIDGTSYFKILNNGNVGIGATNPAEKLEVSGNLKFTTGGLIDSTTTVGAGQNDLTISVPDYLHLKGGYMTYIGDNGAINVSAAAPASSISVTNNYVGVIRAPAATANYGAFMIGGGPWDGATAGFFTGNANGTVLATNAASGYTGDLLNMQIAGVQKFKVDKDGKLYGDGSGLTGVSASGAKLSGLTAADATNTIDSLNFAQTWNWSTLNTQTALSVSADALTSGKILSVTSASTGVTGVMANFTHSGAGAGSNGVVVKSTVSGAGSNSIPMMITNAGNGMSLRINDDGTDSDTTAFFVDATGGVGIGTNSAPSKLTVVQTGASQTALFESNDTGTMSIELSNTSVANKFKMGVSGSLAAYPNLFYLNDDGGSYISGISMDSSSYVGIGALPDTGAKLIVTPPADKIAIRSTGYSLTGANSSSLIDLSGTWNTTGTPTLIKANVTDTASNAASLLMDLQVGGVSKFRVDKTGKLYGDGSGLTNLPVPASTLYNYTVRAATTANIALTGTQTIDGVALSAGDRVLVKNQTTASQNGVYVVAAGAWSRAADMNTWAEIIGYRVTPTEGTYYAGVPFISVAYPTGTLDTTAFYFSPAGTIYSNAGLTQKNTAFGLNALNASVGGSGESTAFGSQALESMTTAVRNTAFGHNALKVATGNENTGIGPYAGDSITTGTRNIAIGPYALDATAGNSYNVGIGYYALKNNTADDNVAVGTEALWSNTTGTGNVGMGTRALTSNVAKHYSTAIGFDAMRYADSTAAGANAYNTAVGAYAFRGSNTAASNTGVYNTAIGGQALYQSTSGSANTSVGYMTLYNNTTGANNTVIGSEAGYNVAGSTTNRTITGSDNVFIGARSGAGAADPINNSIAIGKDAVVAASNAIVLGTSAHKTGLAGITNPAVALHVGGAIKVGADATACGTVGAGGIRLNGTALEFCDGTNWAALATGGGGTSLSGITAATGANTIANATNLQTWNWALTGANDDAFTFGETTAATNGAGSQSILKATNLASSTAVPLMVTNLGDGLSFRVNDETGDNDASAFVVDANGAVGVGIAAPVRALHVHGSASEGYVHMTNTGSGATVNDGMTVGVDATGLAGYVAMRENGPLAFWTNNTEKMRIDAAGNIGIGDTSPAAKIEINSDGAFANRGMRIVASGTTATDYSEIQLAADSQEFRIGVGSSHASNFAQNSFYIYDNDAGTMRMVVDDTGNVGIGTNNPDHTLHVVGYTSGGGPTPRITLAQTNAGATANVYPAISVFNYMGTAITGGPAMQFYNSRGDAGAPSATASGDSLGGFSGNGMANPGAWQHQQGAMFGFVATENFTATSSPGAIYFMTTPSGSTSVVERMRIDSTGNVGIGTNSPAAKLHVSGGQFYVEKSSPAWNATTAIDFNNGNVQDVTLGGNTTFTFSNPKSGAIYILIVKQDATGNRTVTWPATVKWPGGTAPVLTSTANAVDIFTFVSDGTNYYNQGFSADVK